MKTKILLASLLLAGTAILGAVHAKGHFGGPPLEELNLSDAQKEQAQALRQQQREQMQALRASGERPSAEQRQALHAEHRAAFEAILTPQQVATLEQAIAERGDRTMRGKGRRGHRGPRFGALPGLRQLDLSDAQKDQAQALRQQQREQMQAFRASGERPSPEQMQALHAEHRAAFEAILTPQQVATLEQAIAERGDRTMRGKGRRGHRGPRFGALPGLRQLDLSDAQKEQIKAIVQQHRAQMAPVRESGERPTAEQRQAHREQLREAIKTVLTPAQIEQLDAFKHDASAGSTLQDGAAKSAAAVESKSWGAVKEEAKNEAK